jgi:hypothetical protein
VKLTDGIIFMPRKAWLGPEFLQVAVDNKWKRDEHKSKQLFSNKMMQ